MMNLCFFVVVMNRRGSADVLIEDAWAAIAAVAGLKPEDLPENFIVLCGPREVLDQAHLPATAQAAGPRANMAGTDESGHAAREKMRTP